MCWGIQDLPFVEEIFKGTVGLVVRNDCIQRFDVRSEDETMFRRSTCGQSPSHSYPVLLQKVLQPCPSMAREVWWDIDMLRRSVSAWFMYFWKQIEF